MVETSYMEDLKFELLVGKTMSKVEQVGPDVIEFTSNDGEKYKLYHSQDCCESVQVEDICGDINDLAGTPILQAEESSSHDDPVGYERKYAPESQTWTFYRIATIKGAVTIRWLGTSNGYYSERVEFATV